MGKSNIGYGADSLIGRVIKDDRKVLECEFDCISVFDTKEEAFSCLLKSYDDQIKDLKKRKGNAKKRFLEEFNESPE